MSKKKTTDDFIKESVETHGDRYDYSKVKYESALSKVCIVCPKHGEFWQKPILHIRGNGCPLCYKESKKIGVYGKGVTDMDNVSRTKCYKTWLQMLRRCYEKNLLSREPSYNGCEVCEDWLIYSKFKMWFDKHYVDGWELDKDIITKGNKQYSPSTCCFVPKEINCLLTKRQNHRGALPIGVHKTSENSFRFIVSKEGESFKLGKFSSLNDAFNAYKQEKEEQIKHMANKYRDVIEERVYNALINYQVEITD